MAYDENEQDGIGYAESLQREMAGQDGDGDNDGPQPLDDETFESIVGSEIADAVDFCDTEIGPLRAKATDFYFGRPFGDEEEGRSKVVSMDVRDTVQAILPSLLRMFFGSENVVEYAPRRPEDVPIAQQATDYVNQVVLAQDNHGFLTFHSAFKDALVRKTGVIKYWWDESEEVSAESYTGLQQAQITLLSQDPEIEVLAATPRPAPGAPPDPMTGEAPSVFDVDIKRRTKTGKVRIEALPPEEFIIDRRAKSVDEAIFVGHRRLATVSELVALGYDYDDVLEQSQTSDDFDTSAEYIARNPLATVRGSDNADPSQRRVLYVEGYLRCDYDGDGIAELRKVCTMGPGYKVMSNHPCNSRPFATFCPDPEPHTFFGMGVADVLMDIQRIKSAIMRNMLDSLAMSIHPRMGVVEGQANMDDVLNTEVGGVIRMRAPGMVAPFAMPFVGKEAFPMMAYMDEVRENRTGITKAAAGLDADALQSTTKAAVAATISAAQQHIEMIARVFAETGMKRLFKGLLSLITTHVDQPRIVRLTNGFVPVDPRVWDSGMDVTVRVALGGGTTEEKLALLGQIAAKQESVLQTMGPLNPLVTVAQYRQTLVRMLELAGQRDAQAFFLDPANLPPEIQQAMQAQQQQAMQGNPTVMLAQLQAQQIQADIQGKAAQLQLDREKMMRADDRERDRIEADVNLRAAELQMKYGMAVNVAQIKADMERDREAMRAQTAAFNAGIVPNGQ